MVPFIETGNTVGGVHCICWLDEDTSKVLSKVNFKMLIISSNIDEYDVVEHTPLEFRGKGRTRGRI